MYSRILLAVAATFATAGSATGTVSRADLARARLPRPLPGSHVVGDSAGAIFAAMNAHLIRQPYHTLPCEQHSLDQLNDIARTLWSERSEKLVSPDGNVLNIMLTSR